MPRHRSRSRCRSRSRSPSPKRHSKPKNTQKKQKKQKSAHCDQSDSSSDDSGINRPSKRPRDEPDMPIAPVIDAKMTKLYRKVGRGLPRIWGIALEVKQIFKFGAIVANALANGSNLSDALKSPYDELDGITKHDWYEIYQHMLDMVTGFRTIVEGGARNAPVVDALLDAISAGMEAALSDDRRALKLIIGDYIAPNDDEELEKPFRRGSKSGRGLNHPTTARLLCQTKHALEFENDYRATIRKYRRGQYQFEANFYPLLVYWDYVFDPDDIEMGLFRGQVVVRTLRHLLTGPTSASAFEEGGGTRSTNAQIHGIFKVTGRMIAYAYIQARFALSSKRSWSIKDGKFNYLVAYNKVVSQFVTHPNDPWVVETLAWYNKEVFGSEYGRDPNAKDSNDGGLEDSNDPLSLQAKRAKEAAEQRMELDDDTEEDDRPHRRRRIHRKSDEDAYQSAGQNPHDEAGEVHGMYSMEVEDGDGQQGEEPEEFARRSPSLHFLPSSPLTQPSTSPPPPDRSSRAAPATVERCPDMVLAPRATKQPAVAAQGNASAKRVPAQAATTSSLARSARDLFSPQLEPVEDSMEAPTHSKPKVDKQSRKKKSRPATPALATERRRSTRRIK